MYIFAKAKFNRKNKKNSSESAEELTRKTLQRRSGLDYAIGAQTCIMASHSIINHEMCSEISQTKPYRNNKREGESEERYLKEKLSAALRLSRSGSRSLWAMAIVFSARP